MQTPSAGKEEHPSPPARADAERAAEDQGRASTVAQHTSGETGEHGKSAPEGTGEEQGGADSAGWIGRVVDGRYRITGELGQGGMGTVFLAKHLKLDKDVAFKVILPEFAGDDHVAARFAREAMATARLEHPHVASAIDYGMLPEGGAYLVIQLVRGRSLRSIVEESGRIPWRRACEIGAQVADALVAAHAAGIVHRDLKPENILIEPREDGTGWVRVLDFGIARVAADPHPAVEEPAPGRALTKVGTIMGTPGYMSPEQSLGQIVDGRADLYALGVILWEMIAGRELFDTASLTQLITLQLTRKAPPLHVATDDPEVPNELERLVSALLAADVGNRPESAIEVRAVLGGFAHATSTGTSEAVSLAREEATPPGSFRSMTRALSRGALSRMRWVAGVRRSRPGLFALLLAATAMMGLAVVGVVVLMLVTSALPLGSEATPEVQAHIDTMLEAAGRRERREAAEWLQAYRPVDGVPGYALALAKFEGARGCRSRRRAIAHIRDHGDARALPALERIQRAPRSGCGFLSLADCHACIRRDVQDAIVALRGGPSGSSD